MSRDSKHDILFEPLEVGVKTLPNRFYQVPHCGSSATAYPGMQAALRGVKAEGGWGAVFTEYITSTPEDDFSPYWAGTIWDDDDVHNLRHTCEEVHRHGALAGIQLGYTGSHVASFETRAVPRGPSQIAAESFPGWLTYPIEATIDDIHEVQQLVVDGALRAREAGFDLIMFYGGHGNGPAQFLSPASNKRTDEYGGSVENRARFWVETVEKMHAAVGDDCAIVSRVTLDELVGESGVTLEDSLRLIELADPFVDMWDLMIGSMEWGQDIAASRFHPENHEVEWHREVRAHTEKPIVGVGRFTSPDTMVSVIESGQLDVIGSARSSIADPFLPTKVREGRLDDIRECIGNNACVARWASFGGIVCTQNPTMGEEYRRGWHPEQFTRAENADNDVLVLGAGPAGMECAMVLGKRKMRRVHLVDLGPEIGGCMRWIGQLPRLGEWRRLVNYRQIQLDKLKNVEVILETQLDADAVMQYGAELVVLATGAEWTTDGMNWVSRDPIPGADTTTANCLTPEQILLEDKDLPGDRIAVLDCDGYVAGIGIAELLRQRGCEVSYITPFPQPGAYTMNTGEFPEIARLFRELEIKVKTETMVSSIRPGEIETYYLYGEGLQRRYGGHRGEIRAPIQEFDTVEADGIVLLASKRSRDSIYREMIAEQDGWAQADIDAVYRIGDCVAPRVLAELVFDGHRLAREIDSPNPAVPKPYIRERQVWNATVERNEAVIAAKQ